MRDAGRADLAAGGQGGSVVPRVALLERLRESARVTMVSAPPGSGKTVLLRSWISQPGVRDRAAWVAAGREERDPQRFWLSVVGALRRTVAGSVLVQQVSAAPGLDGWALVERLLNDLAPMAEPVWLVIDDVHELDPDQTLRQLELLVLRAPSQLRFVLATRHDVQLALHRLRLEGGLTEIRAADLGFSLAEARELFAAAGIDVPAAAVTMLRDRTEGWAAGLRLAALSLARHPNPEQFAKEFSGTERTVAGYLLAEVLDRQEELVRRLLLRTSVLERVNGELADLLTGSSGGERVLQDLEQANAFVVAVDASRSWFRYHPLLADLLQLELRRTAPGEVTALHLAAAGWFAGHAFVVEAVRHAQAAQDWVIAARLLADHWPGLHLDGRATTVRELLARFPHCVLAADAELAAVAAADELTQGSLEAAAGYLGLAEREMASVPPDRQTQAQLLLRIARLMLARHRADLPAVAEEERQLQATAEAHGADQPGLSQDLRALALIGLDSTEVWTGRFHEAELHVDQGIELARQIGRTYLEFAGLAHLATIGISRSFAQAVEYSMQAIELAKGHGWTDDPAAGAAYMTIGAVLTWQGRLAEAEPWLQRAELTVRAEAQPVAAMGLYFNRAALELGRGRAAAALAALQSAERLAEFVVAPNPILTALRAFRLQVEVRLGETEYAERELAGLDDRDRGCGELRIALAVLRLAQHDPYAARAALAPVLDGSAPLFWPHWAAQAFLLEAIAHDALGDPAAAGRALERALDVAEPDGAVLPFLMQPVPRLLERQAGHCTTHAALIAEIFSQLADQAHALPARPQPLLEPLRESEIRILRYLPTNLTLPEIARELHVSHNTVKTHVRSLYTQLGAHRRAEAVDRARALGLLAPGARTR